MAKEKRKLKRAVYFASMEKLPPDGKIKWKATREMNGIEQNIEADDMDHIVFHLVEKHPNRGFKLVFG